MRHSKAGTPRSVNAPTVNIFIGIMSPTGCTNKLYPYSKKELIIIRLIILNTSFIIFVHLLHLMF